MTAQPDDLTGFYEATYASDPAQAERNGRWRALGALGKADHVVALCTRAGLAPRTIVDVGCGDGALLCELRRRGFGERLVGYEIAQAAVELARGRRELDAVECFDGERLPEADGEYDLGILSHVLEHVPRPSELLAEVARIAGAVVLEVPLEANLSARRASRRVLSQEVGHLRDLDRDAVREIVRGAGLRVAGELDDPLPLAVHAFQARGPAGHARARAKWACRAGVACASPGLARRLFTLHHACLCVPAGSPARGVSRARHAPEDAAGASAMLGG